MERLDETRTVALTRRLITGSVKCSKRQNALIVIAFSDFFILAFRLIFPAVEGRGAAVAAGVSVDGRRARASIDRGGRRHRDQVLVIGHLKRDWLRLTGWTSGGSSAINVDTDVRRKKEAIAVLSKAKRVVRHKIQDTTVFRIPITMASDQSAILTHDWTLEDEIPDEHRVR